MSRLIFHEEGHRYEVDGTCPPSITQIISAISVRKRDGTVAAWFDYSFLSDAKSLEVTSRGTWIADLCALRVNQCHPFPPALLARIEAEAPTWYAFYPAFERWLQRALATGFAPLLVEQPLYSQRYRFAGRPDLVCLLAGWPSIIEIKTGSALDETRVQTAAQALLLEEQETYPHRNMLHSRFALELPGDGGEARLIPHRNDARDRAHFLAALTLWYAHNE